MRSKGSFERSRVNCVRQGAGFGIAQTRLRSCGEPMRCWEVRPSSQGDRPGDRDPCRCRVLREDPLHSLGCVTSGVLPVPAKTNVADSNAPRMAHGVDQAGPCRVPGHVEVAARACRTLIQGRDVGTSERLVWLLLNKAVVHDLPGPSKGRKAKEIPTGDDLVERCFNRSLLNELRGSDITEHPTREGRIYCCCVTDTCSS